MILSQPWSEDYERIIWIDADIMLNQDAPDICKGVPKERIGAVNEQSYLKDVLPRAQEYWRSKGIKYVEGPTGPKYYTDFGLPKGFDQVVQTGVMVLNPKEHRELFEKVYYNYEDKGDAIWNYEMRPLSFEILAAEKQYWISPKFNTMLLFEKLHHYPFIFNNTIDNMIYLKKIAKTVFLNCYFLHFTGGYMEEMELLDWKGDEGFFTNSPVSFSIRKMLRLKK